MTKDIFVTNGKTTYLIRTGDSPRTNYIFDLVLILILIFLLFGLGENGTSSFASFALDSSLSRFGIFGNLGSSLGGGLKLNGAVFGVEVFAKGSEKKRR